MKQRARVAFSPCRVLPREDSGPSLLCTGSCSHSQRADTRRGGFPTRTTSLTPAGCPQSPFSSASLHLQVAQPPQTLQGPSRPLPSRVQVLSCTSDRPPISQSPHGALLGLDHSRGPLTELRDARLSVYFILNHVLKLDEGLRRARSGRVPSAGASGLWSRGDATLLARGCVCQPRSSLNPVLGDFYGSFL